MLLQLRSGSGGLVEVRDRADQEGETWGRAQGLHAGPDGGLSPVWDQGLCTNALRRSRLKVLLEGGVRESRQTGKWELFSLTLTHLTSIKLKRNTIEIVIRIKHLTETWILLKAVKFSSFFQTTSKIDVQLNGLLSFKWKILKQAKSKI